MSSTRSAAASSKRQPVLHARKTKCHRCVRRCRRSVPRGQPPIVALGTPRESPESRDWWREYLDLADSVRNGTFGNLGIRRNLGFVAPPFRGVTGEAAAA